MMDQENQYERDATIYIKGLPKSTCTRNDLYKRFSSVAQLKQWRICSTKGYGSITLFDKSSVDFVIGLEWVINGSKLILSRRPHNEKTDNAREVKRGDDENTLHHEVWHSLEPFRSYTDYQKKKPTFWQDVPHNDSKMAQPRKYRRLHCKFWRNTTIQTCNPPSRKVKHGKKRKRSKIDTGLLGNSICDWTVTSTCSVKQPDLDPETLTQSPTLPTFYPQSATAIISSINEEEVPEQIRNIEFQALSDDPIQSKMHHNTVPFDYSVMNEKVLECKDASAVPVNVHSNGKKYSICVDSSRPLQSLQDGIQRIERIPRKQQLLIYKGKNVDSNSCLKHVQPYDRVEIIVKAKGGMLDDSLDGKDLDRTPTTASSEEEVHFWLKNIVSVHEDTLMKCLDVDGEMLFIYKKDDYKTFAKDYDLPWGQSLRILLFRDGHPCTHVSTEVASWTVYDVEAFIKRIVTVAKSANTLCNFVREAMIDGLVFLLLRKDNSFAHVFAKCSVGPGVIKKIIVKSDHLIQEKTVEQPLATTGQMSGSTEAIDLATAPIGKLEEESGRIYTQTSATSASTTETTDQYLEDTTTENHTIDASVISADQQDYAGIHKTTDSGAEVLPSTTNLDMDDPSSTSNISNNNKPGVEKSFSETHVHDELSSNALEKTSLPQMHDQQSDTIRKVKSSLKPMTPNRTKEYFTFIEKTLHLRTCDSCNTIPCHSVRLRAFTYQSTSLNELQSQLLFFVIHRENDLLTLESHKSLWDQIAKRPMFWLKDRLTVTEKGRIKLTQSEAKLQIKGKECSLIGSQIQLRCVMDKELKTLLKFKNHILLLNRHALQNDVAGYTVALETQIRKKPISYEFTFCKDQSYFLFDSEDFSYQFKWKQIDPVKQGTLQPRDGSFALPIEEMPDFANHHSTTPYSSLSNMNNTQTKIPFKSSINQHQNDSNLSKLSSFKKDDYIDLSHSNNHQPYQNTIKNVSSTDKQSPTSHTIENNRPFGKDSASLMYFEGSTLVELENGGSSSMRYVRYNRVSQDFDRTNNALISHIIYEILTFACGCLNYRQNGTVYFGVGSEDGIIRSEVTGFFIDAKRDRQYITDTLRSMIQQVFANHLSCAVKQCVGSPLFIQVSQNAASLPKYVMEIDIEPKSTLCKDMFFAMTWPLEHGKTYKDTVPTGYVLEGRQVKPLLGNEEQMFIVTEMKTRIKERETMEKVKKVPEESYETAVEKLRGLLLRGQEKLSHYFWYSLVITCPSRQQKLDEEWKNHFKFIKRIPATAIFDFDDESNEKGLCFHLRNPEQSKLYSWAVFEENLGKYDLLQTMLNIPYSDGNIWVFCNGRSDSSNQCKHLKREEWVLQYLTGINQAVNFLKYSIRPGRLLVLMLLLSNDLEGVIDTFGEFISRFGWDNIVVIADDTTVFDKFCKAITLEHKGTRHQLEAISIVGLPWEQVNAAMNEITGHSEYGCCHIPASGGGTIPLEEKILEALTDLEILSAKQCENKTFEDDTKRREFARRHEIEFYRGNKVTWWNYYFRTHVLERHCFPELRDKINSMLGSQRHDTKVATIVINHEPGAGGSTLGKHILWEFRRKYRCAVVKKITERTCAKVLHLHRYKEDNTDVNPVILLVDGVPQSDYSHYELTSKIIAESRDYSNNNKLICCMIVLQREEHLDEMPQQNILPEVFMKKQLVFLKQKCFPEEINWFKDKWTELQETGKDLGIDFKPEHLISFMILRENFNAEYVVNTVHHLMQSLDISTSEFKLLTYASLISAYTPLSRLGQKPFIPLECCDSLMTFNTTNTKDYDNWLERHLSNTIRIFLVIERKENASGMQIRIAHAILAKAVLKEVLHLQNQTLESLVEDFLCCSLFESSTHGVKDLIEITKEMLKRRLKEEYDDDVNTLFSPLIEEVLKSRDDSSESRSPSAASILILGFDKFKDPMIAQSLARLYAKHEKFEDAITWSKKAVELSPGVGRSYCMHTLGYVLKTKFTMDTVSVSSLSPWESIQFLNVIFQSLACFQEAQKDSFTLQDHHFLYSYVDTVSTINMVCAFVTLNVDTSVLFDLTRYLTDEKYIPEEVSSWEDLHGTFKSLQQIGERVFERLEDHVSFNNTYYAHDQISTPGRRRAEHRSFRLLKYKYPSMLSDFAQYFGEERDDPPTHLIGEMKNMWHRRRILKLQGHTYWGFFNSNKMKVPNNKEEELKRLRKIKKHLDKIAEKDSKDISNSVCVNVALGLRGDRSRAPNKDIYKMCRDMIALGKGRLDVGHFFITMFLWPTSQMNIPYDDDAFMTSLKYLSDKSKKNQRQIKQRSTYSVVKDEKTICTPSTQFFLTKYDGLKSICHKTDIYFREQHESQRDGGSEFWEHPNIQNTLKRLKGQLRFLHEGSNPSIQMENPQTPGKDVEIRKTRSGGREFNSEEEVTFCVGFSMAGPIAYDVKPLRYDKEFVELRQRMPPPSKVNHYRRFETYELVDLLKDIKNIQQKQPARRKEREKKLLNDEDDIKTALDIKLGRNLTDFHL